MDFIDLFCGIGGFRVAFDGLGVEGRCVFSSDWEKAAQEVYAANFGHRPVGDITKVAAADIPPHQLLCAGFPCQAFSISGLRRGFEDARGTLFFDVARIAAHHQPEVLLLENVMNFERHDGGRTLRRVRETLDEIGYDSWHRVLNPSIYGFPTSRKRIYIVAFRKDLRVSFDFPQPTFARSSLADLLLPDSETSKQVLKGAKVRMHEKPAEALPAAGDPPLKPVRIGTIGDGGQGNRIYDPRGHAITFSAYGGGLASKTGAYLVNGKVRKLHPRECARVMGFPDSYKIPVSDAKAYRLFGNSVVVGMVRKLQEEILRTLEACGRSALRAKAEG
jgi:DNA (cytosine-5)-methyltransferase 1